MKTKKRFGKRVAAGMLVALMVLSLVHVPTGSVQAASKKKITLNKTVITVKKGKKLKLKAKITDSKLKKNGIVWKSSKKSVATVDSKGTVKGKKNGKAKITATIKGTKNKATCTVYVGTPVKSLSVEEANKTLEIGTSYTIKTIVSPKNATIKDLVYTSSDINILEVSNKGVVTAKAIGQARVTVASKDEACTKKAVVTVTVADQASNSTESTTNNVPSNNSEATTENNTATENNTTTEGNNQNITPEDGNNANGQEPIELDYIMDENNPTRLLSLFGSGLYNNYTVYTLNGYQDTLGKVSEPQFLLQDTEKAEILSTEKFSESIQEANAPKTWAYRIKAKYKDSAAIQTIYIQYQQKDVKSFIDKIYYSGESGEGTFQSTKTYMDESGKECIRLYAKEKGFDSWDTLAASAEDWYETYPKFGFKFDTDTRELVMGIKGMTATEEGRFDEIGRYPLEVCYYPAITEVSEENNYIWKLNALYGEGTVGDASYVVLGEEENLSDKAEFITDDENVKTIEYKPYDEINKNDKLYKDGYYFYLAGELYVTYTQDNDKEATVIYGIYYYNSLHTLKLEGIRQENNIIVMIDRHGYNWTGEDASSDYYAMGTAEELVCGEDCKQEYQFDVVDKVNSVSVAKENETSEYKDYRITIDYAGEIQYILVHYFQMTEEELLPVPQYTGYNRTSYTYTGEDGEEKTGSFTAIRFTNVEGRKTVTAITKEDIDSNQITKINFAKTIWHAFKGLDGVSGSLLYTIETDEDGNQLLSVGMNKNYNSNEIDNVVVTYPFIVQYVPEITLVEPENNYIVSSGVVSDNNGIERYVICAENETPNDEWDFEVTEGYNITYAAEEVTEEGRIGTITITKDGNEESVYASYPVIYKRQNHALEPKYIEAKDNVITSISHYDSPYYWVEGYGDELGEITELVCDSKIDAEYEVSKVENEDWNYEIEVVYKGEKQVIKIKYSKNLYQLLPRWVYYEDDMRSRINLDSWLVEDKNKSSVSFKLAIDAKNFQYWDKLQIVNPSSSISELKVEYSMEQQSSGEYALKMSQGNSSVIIPTIIEYVPRILSFTEKYNYLNVERLSYRESENDLWQFYYIISGEKESLGTNELVIETTDPDANAYYRPYDEGETKRIDNLNCVGEIVLSYTDEKNQTVTKTYPVAYSGGSGTHRVELKNINDANCKVVSIKEDKKYEGSNGDYVQYLEYKVYGLGDTLSDNAFVFDVPADCVSYTVDTTDENYTYVLQITYKDDVQKMAIIYKQIEETDLLPYEDIHFSSYKKPGDENVYYFSSFEIVTKESAKSIVAKTILPETDSGKEWDIILDESTSYVTTMWMDATNSVMSIVTPTGLKFDYPVIFDTTGYHTFTVDDPADVLYDSSVKCGWEMYYAFIPEETGTYTFYSDEESVDKARLFLYDSDMNLIDKGGEEAKIVQRLEAGKIYYIGTYIWNDTTEDTMEYTIYVKNSAL